VDAGSEDRVLLSYWQLRPAAGGVAGTTPTSTWRVDLADAHGMTRLRNEHAAGVLSFQ